MTHYICTGGCKGESDQPGVCNSAGCPLHGHPLKECDCTDGRHHGAFEEKPTDKPNGQTAQSAT